MSRQCGTLAGALLVALALPLAPATAQHQGVTTEMYENAKVANLIGLPVWSADGKELGVVLTASSGADGEVVSIYIAMGSFLGLGERNVEIPAEKFLQLDDRLQLSLTAHEVELLPDAKRHTRNSRR